MQGSPPGNLSADGRGGSVSVVPELSSVALLGIGLGLAAAFRWGARHTTVSTRGKESNTG